MKIILPGERPMSLYEFYAGRHWTKRRAEVNRVRMAVRLQLTGEETPSAVPVHLTVTAYFASSPQDASNICAKLYEDALKGWLLDDDDPQHVRSVRTISRVDKENPRVEINIQPALSDKEQEDLRRRLQAILAPCVPHQLTTSIMVADVKLLLKELDR